MFFFLLLFCRYINGWCYFVIYKGRHRKAIFDWNDTFKGLTRNTKKSRLVRHTQLYFIANFLFLNFYVYKMQFKFKLKSREGFIFHDFAGFTVNKKLLMFILRPLSGPTFFKFFFSNLFISAMKILPKFKIESWI